MAEGVSFKSSAFSAVGLKDTLAHKRSIDFQGNGDDGSSSRSSDLASTIPELTKAEEMQIKRSSSLFTPIHQGKIEDADRRSKEFLNSWRPSNDLMVAVDGASRPRDTQTWSDDGLQVTRDGNQPSVSIIPSHVRDGTPDSTASLGNIRIRRDDGNYRDLNVSNIQRPEGEGQTNARALAQTTRGMLMQFDRLENLEDELERNANNFELRSPGQDRDSFDQFKTTKEKKTWFAPRAIAMLLFLAILIGAVVALLVAVPKAIGRRKSGKMGQILPDPIVAPECEDKVFKLGEEFEFKCIPANHEFRKSLKNAAWYQVKKYEHASLNNESFRWDGSSEKTLTRKSGTNVTCSTEGIYNITFYDKENHTIYLEQGYQMSFRVTVKPSDISVSFTQKQKQDEHFKSCFVATCSIEKDCNHYQPKFFRRIYGNEEDLTHLARCDLKQDDKVGNSVSCSASVSDDLIGNFIHLGCRMEAKLASGEKLVLEEPFLLPGCGITRECKEYLGYGPGPFNCSEKSSHIAALNNASCSFAVLENCFRNRPILSYYKNATRGITDVYVANETISVCRLGWCRNYEYVSKLEVPGVAICGSGYVEPEAPVPQE